MYTMTEKSVRQIEMPGFTDSMKYLSEHPDKDAEITLHWNTMQEVSILNNWITIAHDRQMQPQFRLFWYLRDMLDGTFVAEEQNQEAICFFARQV